MSDPKRFQEPVNNQTYLRAPMQRIFAEKVFDIPLDRHGQIMIPTVYWDAIDRFFPKYEMSRELNQRVLYHGGKIILAQMWAEHAETKVLLTENYIRKNLPPPTSGLIKFGCENCG